MIQEWARLFLKQHQQMQRRFFQNIKKARAKLSPKQVQIFSKSRKKLKNYDGTFINAGKVFSYEETNVSDDPGTKNDYFNKEFNIPGAYKVFLKQQFPLRFAATLMIKC